MTSLVSGADCLCFGALCAVADAVERGVAYLTTFFVKQSTFVDSYAVGTGSVLFSLLRPLRALSPAVCASDTSPAVIAGIPALST